MSALFWACLILSILLGFAITYAYAKAKRYCNTKANKEIKAWQDMKKALER